MARFALCAVTLFVPLLAALFVSGCGNTDPVLIPTGGECLDGAAETCAGGVCISFTPNAQQVDGICSAECFGEGECFPHEGCVGGFPDGRSYCLRGCKSDANCFAGTACLQVEFGTNRLFCWVDLEGGP